ncbi:MAG: leucine-rich repeat domain-containing protein, partial [Muribaculaceae bacterium]|nr:leucine-rich repeat domain-containing protein [Muribaculaceae bacterium]
SKTLSVVQSGISFEDQIYTSVPDGKFTFDMIESWAGEGANQAALVIQWNTGKASETSALVFGYRWDGQATGSDMIRAVVSANPQLYGLIQYTNVSSPTDPNGGYTINGFGWDVDQQGPIQLRDTGDKTVAGGKIYDSADGLFIHPRGYVPGQGGSSDYDYDNWEAVDTNDYWQAGWYTKGYWSYWCKESVTGTFGYSGVGASGRVLSNGSWDGWSFQADFLMSDWKPFEAAPAPIPAGAKTEFTVDGLCYTLKSYASKTVTVSAPFLIDAKPVVEYSGEITIPSSFTDSDVKYTVVGIADGAFHDSKVTKVVLPSSVTEIGKMAFKGSQLADINVGDEVKKIGAYAFMGCPIKAPFFTASITDIAEGTYYGSAVTTAIIPSHVTAVGDSAFAACASLSEISLPKSVTTLGAALFANCDAVNTVTVDATYPMAISEDVFSTNTYAKATLNIPDGFKSAYAKANGWSRFANVKEYTIAANVGDKFAMDGVTYVITALGDSAAAKVTYCNFDGKPTYANITTANKQGYIDVITIPATINYQGIKLAVNELNDSAFYGASELTGVTLPATITRLPKHLFNGCTKLTGVNIPSAVTEIGEYAFNNCAVVNNIDLPDDLVSIGRYA